MCVESFKLLTSYKAPQRIGLPLLCSKIPGSCFPASKDYPIPPFPNRLRQCFPQTGRFRCIHTYYNPICQNVSLDQSDHRLKRKGEAFFGAPDKYPRSKPRYQSLKAQIVPPRKVRVNKVDNESKQDGWTSQDRLRDVLNSHTEKPSFQDSILMGHSVFLCQFLPQ